MKLTVFTLTLLLTVFSFKSDAQPDMTDTRSKRESFARLPKDGIRDEVSRFVLSGVDEAVGKGELKKLTSWSVAPGVFKLQGGDSIKAAITTTPFVAGKHKMEYDEKWLTKIDRKTYYGGYPDVPKTFISSVTMVVGKDTIAIPPVAYFDLYNLNFTYMDKAGVQRSRSGIFSSKDGKRLYLYLFCKDKTGNYEVTYIIQDKKFVRRVLDFGLMQ
ncbi:hypothetical protein BH09BAC2_BH09BAC2_16910 [soil metagenome]